MSPNETPCSDASASALLKSTKSAEASATSAETPLGGEAEKMGGRLAKQEEAARDAGARRAQELATGEAAKLPANLQEMLARSQILNVAVIDDVYDSPSIASLGREGVEKFAQELADLPEFHSEATAIGLRPESGELVERDLNALWEWCLAHPEGEFVAFATEALFGDRLKRRKVVDGLCSTLKATEGIQDVSKSGAEGQLNAKGAQLVFLDFILDDKTPGETAILKLKEIYASGNKPPFVILISDRPSVDPARRFEICKTVGTLGGYFGFITKDDLNDEISLALKLSELGIGLGHQGHEEIRAFASALATAAKTSLDELEEFVRGMELQDYVHLQSKRLQNEGEPLGSYIQWLLESHLGHALAVSEAVKTRRAEVDKLVYRQLLPCAVTPSDHLVRAFFMAQTEPQFSDADGPQLGDVYLHADKKVARLIISPACDLVRNPPAQRPVFVVQGSVDNLHDHPDTNDHDATECFLVDGDPLRINWDIDDGVRSITFSNLESQMSADGFERRARLRPIFAVAIQRLFADRLCRVGLPVAPPIGMTADVQLYVHSTGGTYLPIGDVLRNGAQVRSDADRLKGRLTVEAAGKLRGLVKRHLSDPNTLEGLPYAAAFAQQREAIAVAVKRQKFWLKSVGEFTQGLTGRSDASAEPDVLLGETPTIKAGGRHGPLAICIFRRSAGLGPN